MRIRVRTLKRLLIVAGLAAGLLAVAVPVLADYTGPDRDISTWVWRRLACRYQAEYDEPGPGGYYSCTLRLYRPPDGSCPGNVGSFFNSTACVGWPGWLSCDDEDCDISRSSSVESCNEGSEGCRAVEQTVSQPPATIDDSIACDLPGSGAWCRGGGHLSLSGSEPLAGYEILALEGTHNGTGFGCEGASCDISLLEGGNDFSFWALSSYGDTSNMGSASAGLDSQDPSLSGSVSGTSGDNGWYVSDVTIEASGDDGTSGLASLDVQINGGGWSSYSGPFTLGDGSFAVELRAVDGAGNSRSESFGVNVDTQGPFVDLAATPSFCPRCGEFLAITAIGQDGGSGLASWSITADGVEVASGSGDTGTTISWDGGGLGGGLHTLVLEGRDAAGNSASISVEFSLVEPTPKPKRPDNDDDEDEDDEPIPVSLPSATPSASSTMAAATRSATRTPTSTRTPLTIQFGGLPGAPAGPPSGEDVVPDLQSPPPASASGAASTVSPVLYGGAAAAVIAAATAIGLAEKKRRDEEAARKRAEMKAANARAEANDQARAAALAAAKEKAEFDLTMGQIVNQATGGSTPSAGWLAGAAAAAAEAARRLARKEEKLEPKIPPARPPFVFFRSSKRESVSVVAPKKRWWEQAIDWVDQHQVEVAIGLGVVAAVAAVVLTGGAALPVVAAVVAAGAVSAAGTVGLNAYYDRPLGENVLRNGAVSMISGAVTAGAYALATSGLVAKAVIGAGNAVATACAANPAVCARLEPALQAVDTAEQVWLSAQLAVQTATGDPRAGETYLELQLEQMDGGVPGNTALRKIDDLGENATTAVASIIQRHGDEALEFIQRHGDAGIGFLATYGDDAFALAALHTDEVVQAFGRHGDKGVEVIERYGSDFLRRSEALGIDPTEVLSRPPIEGQTLEGWLLGVTDRANPANRPLLFNLSDETIQAVAEAGLHNQDSALFGLGFTRQVDVPYTEFAERHGIGYFAVSDDVYGQFRRSDALGDFWQVNSNAIEQAVSERKIFVLNVDLDVVRQASASSTSSEVSLVLRSGYEIRRLGGRDFLVPVESLNTFESTIEYAAPSLVGP